MIATVTTSTIAAVTTMGSLGVIMGVVAVVALLVFLCVRELAGAGQDGKRKFLARSLEVGIVPLFIAFVMIMAVKLVAILS